VPTGTVDPVIQEAQTVSQRPVPVEVRAEARDQGLRRVRGVTGWAAAVATVGCVGLAGGYAAALPGKAYTRAASTAPAPAASGPAPSAPAAARRPGHQSGGGGRTKPSKGRAGREHQARRAKPLQAPAKPPAATHAPATTTSGGS
jgi:hypothetical protein